MNEKQKSLLVYLPGVVLILLTVFYYSGNWDIHKSLSWDVLGYYLYLPTTFLYDDVMLLKYAEYDALIKEYNLSDTFYQIAQAPNGNRILKYTMGKAVLISPFYFISDLYAMLFDYKRDGFSSPYHYGYFVGNLIYASLGIYFTSRLLIKLYSKKIAFIVITLFIFGTNFYANTAIIIGNVHVPLFFLYSGLLWYTYKWHKDFKLKSIIWVAFFYGMLILTRPPEGIAIFIPLLWGVTSWSKFKEKLNFLKSKKEQLIIAFLISTVIVLPQLLYWQIIGGEWVITDYGNPAEGFDWFSPHLLDSLFSYRKGWLLYTPMMLLAIFGFYWLYKVKRELFASTLIFSLFTIYVTSSWSCWWFANSFGNRGYVHGSVVFLIPLSAIFSSLKSTKGRAILFSIAGLLLVFNQFQHYQFIKGIIHGTRMSGEYYWSVFGRTELPEGAKEKLMIHRPGAGNDVLPPMSKIKLVKTFNFDYENPKDPKITHEHSAFSGKYGTYTDDSWAFSEGIDIPLSEITNKEHAWLKIKAKVKPTWDYKSSPFSIVSTFKYKGKNYKYFALDSEKLELKINEWNDIEIIYLTPEIRTKDDSFSFYLWNRAKSYISMDQVEIEIYESK